MQTPVTYALAQADRENLPWVICVRGNAIRLYSTTTSGAAGQRGRTETYVELDLALIPEDKVGYLHLLFSSEALEIGGVFEEIQQASRDFTTGLSQRLRERVYVDAIPRLALAIASQVGGTNEKDLAQHYHTALTILFRLLFIAYAEDSRLLPLHANASYTDQSLKTLARRLSDSINAGKDLGFDDPITGRASLQPEVVQGELWQRCQTLFKVVDKGHASWGVPAYNGGLFSSDPAVNPVGWIIQGLAFSNAELGPVITALLVDRSPDAMVGPIDFRSLSVREFGTIYEGLLESELSVAEQDLTVGRDGTYLPAKEGDDVVVPAGDVYLHNASGQRKASGSYFTKPFAVEHLLERALDPTLAEHLTQVATLLQTGREADASDLMFDFRVADISMGSGHFLTAVVDRIEAKVSSFLAEHPIPHVAEELATLRKSATEALGDNAEGVVIESSALLRRLIARRCVYGVDINPISVELARVSVWIHTFVPGLPLSFLNHNLAVGDSLTGVATIEEAAEAMLQVDGAQIGMFNDPLREALAAAEAPLKRLANLVDATPKDISMARRTADDVRIAIEPVAAFFDIAVAIRIGQAQRPVIAKSSDMLELTEHNAREVIRELGSLHFPIAFPEVFLRNRPGFDVIVGNPPWDKWHVEGHEFWARHFPGLRGLPTSQRDASITGLENTRPDLVRLLELEREDARRRSEILSSGPYALGVGHNDLAQAFAWRIWDLLRDDGRFGVVFPRQAILAAPGMKAWRSDILDGGSFDDVSLLVNNREWVFDSVHAQYTVGLVTARKGGAIRGVRLGGPYRSLSDYASQSGRDAALIGVGEFAGWSGDLAFPLLSEQRDIEVYRALLRHPRVGGPRTDWAFRPVQGDINATADKHLYESDVTKGGSCGPSSPERPSTCGRQKPGMCTHG